MPELAEVEYFRKRWDPALGKKIEAVHLHPHSRIFRGVDLERLEKAVTGSRLQRSFAHGKQMLFEFNGGKWMGIHLGMTGKLRLEPAGFTPGKHDHLVLVQAKHSAVFSDPRHFGRVRFDQSPQPPVWWTQAPPDVRSKEFTLDLLAAFLRRRSRTSIKAVLLMQERFPGIGNWMADEILWRSRILPSRLAGQLTATEVKRLWTDLRKVSHDAVRIISDDWSDPPKSWLFLHRWQRGGLCPRCQVTLTRRAIGGRTTCYCPRCQK